MALRPTPVPRGAVPFSGSGGTIPNVPVAAGQTLYVVIGWNASALRSITSLKHGTATISARGLLITKNFMRARVYSLYFATASTANLVLVMSSTCVGGILAWTV